jgi:hypothetical protein
MSGAIYGMAFMDGFRKLLDVSDFNEELKEAIGSPLTSISSSQIFLIGFSSPSTWWLEHNLFIMRLI